MTQTGPRAGFRTIQVRPKDLPALMWQAAIAANRPGGKVPMFDKRGRELIPLLGGAAAAWADAGAAPGWVARGRRGLSRHAESKATGFGPCKAASCCCDGDDRHSIAPI